jgi:hypothetical protein
MATANPDRTPPLIRLGWIPDPPGSPLSLFPALLGPHELTAAPDELWSVHVVGRPGFGKSVLLGNLALQFHQAGEGVLLVDVKGDLARQVAARAPAAEQLVYVAPHRAVRAGHYWSLNPLAFDRADHVKFEFYANALPVVFERIGGYEPELMQRIRKTLSSAVRLALASRESCFGDVYAILHDKTFRDELLQRPHVHPYAWDYWHNTFAAMSARDQRQQVDSTDSRLRAILDPTYLNYALNQVETTLTIPAWLDAGKLVVINLDQGQMGIDTARAFANLLLGSLVNDIVQRPTGQTARPWRLIIDEATELSTEPFAEAIEQMRTYSVFPVFSHQSIEQLDELKNHQLRRAARQADVSIALNLSHFDAATLRRQELVPEATPSADALERYTATIEFARRPPGPSKRATVRLYPFLTPEIPGQLALAEAHQLELTRPASQLRYLYKDAAGKRLVRRTGRGSHEPPSPAAPPRPRPLRPGPGQNLRDGDDSPGLADAGGAPPVSLSDLVAGGQAALPRPAQPGRRPTKRGRRPQGRQPAVPQAAEGPAVDRVPAGDAADHRDVSPPGVPGVDPGRPPAAARPSGGPWGGAAPMEPDPDPDRPGGAAPPVDDQ